jgi:arylsulfatase A-like enzyme
MIHRFSIAASVIVGLMLVGNIAAQERPSVIHIMVDDLGWRDLSVYGSETFQTPNIDALAARGMRFSNAYSSSPLCSPTRASIITGQTCGRLNFTSPTGHLPKVVLDPQESESGPPGMPMTIPQTASRVSMEITTIGEIFKQAGYHTAFMGKWHLGHAPYIPENYGFDFVVGGRGTPGPPAPGFFGPWPPAANFPEVEGNPNADDVMGDEAVKWIADKAGEPFFLALWLYNVHAPFQGKPDDIEAYRPFAESAWYQRSAIMGSMVKTLDDNVGKVIAELERQNLLEDTIVIFTSDNGGNMYDRPEGENPTNNHPLRAGKGNNYEGGIRVPFIVSWPGQIEFDSVSDVIMISYDFYPTVLDMLDLPPPDGHPLDGVSLLPAFRGQSLERGPVYTVFPHTVLATGNYANVAMRDGKWKMLRFFHSGPDQEDEYELYDLSADPGETRNLAMLYPEVTQRMSEQMANHLKETGTLLPRRNPHYSSEYRQAGFQMVSGGIIAGGGKNNVAITSKGPSVALRYHVPADAQPGDLLEFNFMSNCAVSITAGPGLTPVFAKPVIVRPDLENRRVRVPLGATVSAGVITLIIDLVQPGRMHLQDAALRRPEDLQLQGVSQMNGWQAGRETVGLQLVEGSLVVHSTAADPWIEIDLPEPLTDGAPFTLRFEILADGPGDLRLYDRSQPGRGFTPQAKVDASLPAADGWVEISGRLPSGAPLHAIRISPPNRPGQSRLRNIRVEDAEGKVVKHWFSEGAS